MARNIYKCLVYIIVRFVVEGLDLAIYKGRLSLDKVLGRTSWVVNDCNL